MYQQNIQDLFERWQKRHNDESESEYDSYKNGNVAKCSFCNDGIIDADEYVAADKKILFIAKEGNEGRRSTENKVSVENAFWLQNVAKGVYSSTYFARRLAILANAYHNENYENPNNDIAVLRKCAFMNLNKRGGYSRCNTNTLRCYTEKYVDLVKEEIEIISPNLIICCGKGLKDLLCEFHTYPNNIKIIEVFHPSYFVISNMKYIKSLESALE